MEEIRWFTVHHVGVFALFILDLVKSFKFLKRIWASVIDCPDYNLIWKLSLPSIETKVYCLTSDGQKCVQILLFLKNLSYDKKCMQIISVLKNLSYDKKCMQIISVLKNLSYDKKCMQILSFLKNLSYEKKNACKFYYFLKNLSYGKKCIQTLSFLKNLSYD